jgi:hypothetical protein
MGVNSVGMTVGGCDEVTLWASRSEPWACLVIDTEGMRCEITMDRVVVESLRDQLPEVLAGLDRWAAEDAGCARAGAAEQRAVNAAAQALDLATAVEAAGGTGAAALREAAAEVTAKANVVDDAVAAFESATAEADHAAERLAYRTCEAAAALRRLPGSDQPAQPVGGGIR